MVHHVPERTFSSDFSLLWEFSRYYHAFLVLPVQKGGEI
nr:MAG TPA: hypothetical protein [Caudoviricetes sp.]